MGRRTLHKPQFKERRGNGVQAQLFVLRRALAVKAQLVKNQQQQIDLLGRELANACIRIATLERSNTCEEETWERIIDLAVARSRASLDQAATDALCTGAGAFAFVAERMDLAPPSDGVFDERLHDADRQVSDRLAVSRTLIEQSMQRIQDWAARTTETQRVTVELLARLKAGPRLGTGNPSGAQADRSTQGPSLRSFLRRCAARLSAAAARLRRAAE